MEDKMHAIVEARRVLEGASQTMAAGFMTEVERIIGLLGTQRLLRLSLFCFELDGLPQAAAVKLVDRALKPHGLVGALPDGRVGFLYLGPRGKRNVADLALVHHITERLRIEIYRQTQINDVSLVSSTVVHRWADEVVDVYDLVDGLRQPILATKAS
jgi:hypothetical protein